MQKKKLNWHHWLPGPWYVGSTGWPAIHGISQSFNPETFPDMASPFWDCTRSWATTRWSTSVPDGSLCLSTIPTGISMRTWPLEGWTLDTFTLSRMRTTLVLSKNWLKRWPRGNWWSTEFCADFCSEWGLGHLHRVKRAAKDSCWALDRADRGWWSISLMMLDTTGGSKSFRQFTLKLVSRKCS